MAIKKNTSTKQVPSTSDTYATLQTLLQRISEVGADLTTSTERELASDDEMFLNGIITGLKQSSMAEMLVREYHNAGEGNFQLLVYGARMYLAGKCSAQRYDDAAPQPVAAEKPHDPRPLRSAA